MPEINFFAEDVDFAPARPDLLRQWLGALAIEAGREWDTLNYIFCSDEYLLAINQQYLQHDYYTDIITFPHHESEAEPIGADLFLSIERIRENSKTEGVEFAEELHRVMAHGLLHLLGHHDHTPSEKETMRAAENEALARLADIS